uniref:Uncharacterized protein n=1 Tax=Ciona intestinalis TaxID=7719 RepID=H2XR10_CIOIN
IQTNVCVICFILIQSLYNRICKGASHILIASCFKYKTNVCSLFVKVLINSLHHKRRLFSLLSLGLLIMNASNRIMSSIIDASNNNMTQIISV